MEFVGETLGFDLVSLIADSQRKHVRTNQDSVGFDLASVEMAAPAAFRRAVEFEAAVLAFDDDVVSHGSGSVASGQFLTLVLHCVLFSSRLWLRQQCESSVLHLF